MRDTHPKIQKEVMVMTINSEGLKTEAIPVVYLPIVSRMLNSLESGDIVTFSEDWREYSEGLANALNELNRSLQYFSIAFKGGAINALIEKLRSQMEEVSQLIEQINNELERGEVDTLREAFQKLLEVWDELTQGYMALLMRDAEQSISPLPYWDKLLKLFPIWYEEMRDNLELKDMLISILRELANSLETEESWLREIQTLFPEVEFSQEPFQLLEGLKLALGVFAETIAGEEVPEKDVREAYRVALEGSRQLSLLRNRVREVIGQVFQGEEPFPLIALRRIAQRNPIDFPHLTSEIITWLVFTRRAFRGWAQLPLVELGILSEEEFNLLPQGEELATQLIDLLSTPYLSEEEIAKLRELSQGDVIQKASQSIEKAQRALGDDMNLGELGTLLTSLITHSFEVLNNLVPESHANFLVESLKRSLNVLAVLLTLKYLETKGRRYLDLLEETVEFLLGFLESLETYSGDQVNLILEALPNLKTLLEKLKDVNLELQIEERIVCPRCGASNPITATHCQRCGFMFSDATDRRKLLKLNVRMPEKLEEVLYLSTLSLKGDPWREEALASIDAMIETLNQGLEEIDETLNKLRESKGKFSKEDVEELENLRDKLGKVISALDELAAAIEEEIDENTLMDKLSDIADSWKELAPIYFKVMEGSTSSSTKGGSSNEQR